MIKWSFLLCFFSFPLLAAEALDYSCQAEKGHQTFLVATKSNKNIINLALKIDLKKCEIVNEKDIMNLFWKVGEKEKRGVIPCQKISKFEKKFFNLEESDIKRISKHRALITYQDLQKNGEKFGHSISEEIEVEVYRGHRGACKTKTTIFADSRPIVIDRIHNEISFFSLKEIIFYNNSSKVLILN